MGLIMKIIQMVGYKDSGKTTLINYFIEAFNKDNYRVATIKHHGHGGQPLGIENTDSETNRQAGAVASAVEGDGLLQLSLNKNNISIENILFFYQQLAMDFVFIEGYKKIPFPKILLIKDQAEIALLEEIEKTVCILDRNETISSSLNIPVFHHAEELLSYLKADLTQFADF